MRRRRRAVFILFCLHFSYPRLFIFAFVFKCIFLFVLSLALTVFNGGFSQDDTQRRVESSALVGCTVTNRHNRHKIWSTTYWWPYCRPYWTANTTKGQIAKLKLSLRPIKGWLGRFVISCTATVPSSQPLVDLEPWGEDIVVWAPKGDHSFWQMIDGCFRQPAAVKQVLHVTTITCYIWTWHVPLIEGGELRLHFSTIKIRQKREKSWNFAWAFLLGYERCWIEDLEAVHSVDDNHNIPPPLYHHTNTHRHNGTKQA